VVVEGATGPAPSSYSSTQSGEATGTLASDDQLAALREKLAGGGQS
jgi:small subunit ribosomal protein S1